MGQPTIATVATIIRQMSAHTEVLNQLLRDQVKFLSKTNGIAWACSLMGWLCFFMMPRDMDLIRELLLRFERGDKSVPPDHTQEEVAYHVELLIDAGFLKGSVVRRAVRGHKVPSAYFVQDITWKGHDFIASIRNDAVWKRTKPNRTWSIVSAVRRQSFVRERVVKSEHPRLFFCCSPPILFRNPNYPVTAPDEANQVRGTSESRPGPD